MGRARFGIGVVFRQVESERPDVTRIALDVQANSQTYERAIVERDGVVMMDVSEPREDADSAA